MKLYDIRIIETRKLFGNHYKMPFKNNVKNKFIEYSIPVFGKIILIILEK